MKIQRCCEDRWTYRCVEYYRMRGDIVRATLMSVCVSQYDQMNFVFGNGRVSRAKSKNRQANLPVMK